MISSQTWISGLCIVLYLISIFVIIGLFIGGILRKVVQDRALSRRSSQFPCGRCRYFTDEALLKCAVHPTEALTELAMNCQDFEARQR